MSCPGGSFGVADPLCTYGTYGFTIFKPKCDVNNKKKEELVDCDWSAAFDHLFQIKPYFELELDAMFSALTVDATGQDYDEYSDYEDWDCFEVSSFSVRKVRSLKNVRKMRSLKKPEARDTKRSIGSRRKTRGRSPIRVAVLKKKAMLKKKAIMAGSYDN